MNYEIRRVEGNVTGTIAMIREQLGAWNSTQSSIAEEQEIAIEALGSDHDMIGGLAASIWGSVMELEFLWVAERMRGKGVGSDLLQSAEAIAMASGCTIISTHSYSFQAPDFYRKFGFTAAATLDGFPGGISKYILVKRLSAEPNGGQGGDG